MHVFVRLLARRFRRRHHHIPFIAVMTLQLLLWVSRSIAEQIIFTRIADSLGIPGEGVLVILAVGTAAILARLYLDTRREFTSQHLQTTLKEMHKRLLKLKDSALSQGRLDRKQLEMMTPVLMHKLGLVDLERWDKFTDSIAAQLRRPITEKSKQRGTWYYKVSGVASRIKKELVESKDWTMTDLDIIVDWFDSQAWGLRELRDNDKHWNRLYEAIEPFTRDSDLRELINRHLSLSYGSCTVLLITGYSRRWRNSIPLTVLHETLVGSPLSPTKIDSALSEVLGSIDKRMNVLSRRGRRKRR